MKTNFWKENVIAIIDKEGTLLGIPRKENEMYHLDAFLRTEFVDETILKDFNWNQRITGGFELSSFIAANGKAVVWPSNINDDLWMVISVPENGTTPQYQKVSELLETLNDRKVVIMSVRYKKENNKKSRIIRKEISSSGDYQRAVEEWNAFCEKKELNDMMKTEKSEQTEIKQK